MSKKKTTFYLPNPKKVKKCSLFCTIKKGDEHIEE
jgi:hypothetical protein